METTSRWIRVTDYTMKKLTLLFFLIYCLCISVNAQVNREALKSYIEDVKIYEKAVNNLKIGKYKECISAISTLIELRKQNDDYPLDELASYYILRCQGQIRIKEYQLAIDDGEMALLLLQKEGGGGKKELTTLWNILSTAYYYLGKQKETMEAVGHSIQMAIDCYGPMHSETMNAYSLRSNYAGFYNLKETALSDRQKVFGIIQQNIKKDFVYLTATERTSFWEKFRPETTIMFTFAHKLNEWQSDYTDDLYNQQLLAKGLLLTAETSLQRAIDSDANLSAAYKKIRQLRKQATESKNDKALIEADRLERSLGTSASELYQFLAFLKINATDVRAKLQRNDIAIEFVDYRIGKDSTMYAALVMSPRWQHVRFLPLIEVRELSKLSDNLTERIWRPILEIIGDNVENIYFSPTGLLYQLPIESHLMADGRSMGEAYHMYRLSSTRWLALNDNSVKGKDAVIYGGLAFNASVSEMQQDAKRYPQTRSFSHPKTQTRGAVSGLDYLPGTKTEAEAIAKALNTTTNKGLHADLLLGKDGTEASFKSLDGQQKQIVHIATHGFYDDNNITSIDVLSCCGLYFAGADNVLQGETIPSETDDGILTAQEISFLDLHGLNLVALSACQTGDGKITGDGVFGLQRGFKKAGAQSLLMSLWPVDDAATSLLMTEFYKNWIGEGKTKHDALELAKQTVRSHKEKGWDAPKYWAAFILLDGLD